MNLDPQTVGLLLIALALVALLVRFTTRGRTGTRRIGQLAAVIIIVDLVGVIGLVALSVLRAD